MVAAFVAVPAQSALGAVAAPNGRAGAACTDSDPCDLRSAVRAAGGSGEVALRPGTYDLRGASQIVIDGGIWVHGPVGGPRPVLIGDAPGGVIRVADRAAVLEHVSVEPVVTAKRGIVASSGVARDVIVRVSATGAAACELVNGMVVSSVCWSSGSGGSGAVIDAASNDAAGVIVGSTVVAQTAVKATSSSGHSGTVAIDSSILLGGIGGHDIATSGTGEQRVITSYSNFDDTAGPGYNSLGGDQSSVPLLVDPANGDFHQREGSPTIDVGSPVNNIDHGRYDIDGDARTLGGRTDVGADEFRPAGVPGPSTGGDGGTDGGGESTGNERPAPRSGRPARITRLRVVFRGSAASAHRTRGARAARAMFRLDRSSSVRLTLIRIGRRSDQETTVVVRGRAGFNDIVLRGRLGRALRRNGSFVLAARPNGGRTTSVRFRIGSGPDRFTSSG